MFKGDIKNYRMFKGDIKTKLYEDNKNYYATYDDAWRPGNYTNLSRNKYY